MGGAWCKRTLRSAQRPLILAISKSFKSNSTLSSLILANLQPIDLEIKKRICFTALTGDSFPLPPSSAILVNDKVSSIRRLGPPLTCTYRQFLRSAISTKLADDWNEEWVSSEKASQTRSFFPTVSHSDMLSSCLLHAAMVQVLTGHSLLNGYQAKINRRNSALCDSGAEEETVSHFLFDCSLSHDAIAPFKRAIQSLKFLMASQPISNASADKFLALDGRLYSQVKTVSVKPLFSHSPFSPVLSQFLCHRFVQRRPCSQFYQLTPCVILVRVEAEGITWSESVRQRFPNHNPLPQPPVTIAINNCRCNSHPVSTPIDTYPAPTGAEKGFVPSRSRTRS